MKKQASLQQNRVKSTVFRPFQLLLEQQSTNSQPRYRLHAWEARMTLEEAADATQRSVYKTDTHTQQ